MLPQMPVWNQFWDVSSYTNTACEVIASWGSKATIQSAAKSFSDAAYEWIIELVIQPICSITHNLSETYAWQFCCDFLWTCFHWQRKTDKWQQQLCLNSKWHNIVYWTVVSKKYSICNHVFWIWAQLFSGGVSLYADFQTHIILACVILLKYTMASQNAYVEMFENSHLSL